ncbi:hypothetical protein MKW94_026625 [Papaver nudicaule]|uniref:Neprosin PEP catalytic domain-containing protein n=1 Tax=Papaver nudicaule TaxID=74823 RepID=A0AA41VDA9_PAPNU|nr:hypothetical protein [Papaver nudicaule]
MEFSHISLTVFVVLISFVFAAKTHSIYGKTTNVFKQDEDIELESQLKTLNKKPVKTIMTNYGDTVDCIDIYKQPAFDHPLLKHHKIRMVPSFIIEETTSKNISSPIFRGSIIDIGFQDERCPPGTVPIRRTKKEDLVNAQSLSRKTNRIHTNRYSPSPINHHFVSVEEFGQAKTYFGGAALMSVHRLKLNYNQFSTVQIWIENGPVEEINSIEFGWLTYPALFGDNNSRLFGYWTVDGHKQTGCFNVLCPGFVQVNEEVLLGGVLEHTSVYGKQASEFPIRVYRDAQTGDWWLVTNVLVGYWPKEIFTHLASNASNIRYGGTTGEEPQTDAGPMGNGYLPQLQDYTKTAYMRKMKYINDKEQLVNINPDGAQTKHDTISDCYNLLFAGNLGEDWETTMTFGGPGGQYCTS